MRLETISLCEAHQLAEGEDTEQFTFVSVEYCGSDDYGLGDPDDDEYICDGCATWCDKRITFKNKADEKIYQFSCAEDSGLKNYMFDPLRYEAGSLHLLNEEKWIAKISNEYLDGDSETAESIYRDIVQIQVYEVKAEQISVYREIKEDATPYAE